jgi:hypothetical protein
MSTDVNASPQITLPAAASAILQGVPNLILTVAKASGTPHIAGGADESNLRVSPVTAHSMLEVLAAS